MLNCDVRCPRCGRFLVSIGIGEVPAFAVRVRCAGCRIHVLIVPDGQSGAVVRLGPKGLTGHTEADILTQQ